MSTLEFSLLPTTMPLILLFLIVGATASDHCQTPTQQPGQCVLINHCPHLLSAATQGKSDGNSSDLIKKSHCGFESLLFPKVCCPLEAVKLFAEGGAISHNQHATKCGLHEPDGPSDPWLALLEYENSNGEQAFLCGGVLVNKRYVLTAAHCLSNFPNFKLVRVHFGKLHGGESELVLGIDTTTVHEEFDPEDPNRYNDIALVRLKSKVSFKDGFVKPICIPTDNRKNYLRKTLAVTGYQKHGDGAKKRDGVATVWNNSECHLVYNSTEVRLRASQMCAGAKRAHYRHSYRTDLGGVLMHVAKDDSYSAVGVLSLEGSCCGRENNPKVYTRVGSYMEWIISNLKP